MVKVRHLYAIEHSLRFPILAIIDTFLGKLQTRIKLTTFIFLCFFATSWAQCDGISGVVFIDKNASGTHDGGEIGVADIKISIFDQQNTLIATQYTADDGRYYIGNLPPTPYRVTFNDIPSWFSPSVAGPDSGTDVQFVDLQQNCMASLGLIKAYNTNSTLQKSDPINWGGSTSSPSSQQMQLLNKPTIEIGNYVWYDENSNGLQDPSERGLANVNVSLYNQRGEHLLTVQTGQNGQYYFNSSNLPNRLQPKQNYYVIIGSQDGTGAKYIPIVGLKVEQNGISQHYLLTQKNIYKENICYDSDGTIKLPTENNFPAMLKGFPYVKINIANSVYTNHNCDFGFTLSNLTEHHDSPIDTSGNR